MLLISLARLPVSTLPLKIPVNYEFILYIIRELEKEIHVLRVLREERDWESILERQHDYTY